MKSSRRDVFKFLGGSVVGAMFTPVPWRLITDLALWTQDWPGIPKPTRGEIKAKFTNCALCPAGCAVRARCVGEMPVSLAGVAAHPLSQGALCPIGLAGHHLPYHPERVREGSSAAGAGAIANAIDKCGPGERVAVLDLRPGRTASWTYRRAMGALENGAYLTAPRPLDGAAVDLSNARTVLSIGAPLLEGWGTPGNVFRAREGFRLIQAEPLESRTAVLADQWLRIQPGSESALALGLANLLLERNSARNIPASLAEMAGGFTLARAAAATGLDERQIVDLASELSEDPPALVLAGDNVPEALALNQLTGAWGETIVARREPPVPSSWTSAAPVADLTSVADGSIRALMIDESAPGDYLPWNLIERKLVRDNPVVVTFAWTREGYGRHALFVLPTAVYPEVTDDVPPAVDAPAATFRISAPLVTPPEGMVDPREFVASAAGIDAGNALRERADAIHQAGRGSLLRYGDGVSTAVRELESDDFWTSLYEGGCWIDEAGQVADPPTPNWAAFTDKTVEGTDLPLVAVVSETQCATVPVSPLMTKLHQESNLHLGRSRAAMHPDTARASGVGDRERAVLETSLGRCDIEVMLSSSVPSGLVEVAAGPEVFDVCGALARARVVRA